MQRERISIPQIVLYLLLALILYVLQTSWFGTWSIRGYHLDLLPAIVAAAALLDGPVEGVILGVAVGLFYDLGFIGVDGLYPLFFMLFGLVAGALSRLALSGSYVSMLLMTAFEMIVLGLIRYFVYLLPQAGASFLLVLQQIVGGTLLTCVFCLSSISPCAKSAAFLPTDNPDPGKEETPMVNKNQLLRRLLVLGCLLLLCFGLAGGQLVQLQLVNGESYLRRSAEFLTTTSTVSAARGEILDRYGRPMVTNQTGFSLVLIYASFWEDQPDRFEKLLDLANRVRADGGTGSEADAQTETDSTDGDEDSGESGTDTGETADSTTDSGDSAVLNDVLPITSTAPYEYIGESGSSDRNTLSKYIKASAETLGLQAVQDAVAAANTANEQNPQYDADGNEIDQVGLVDATTLVTADEFIDAMRVYLEENANRPTDLSDADVRTLVGLYYSMRQVGFGTSTTFTLADNISMDLIAYIKEHHQDYEGVDIESEAVRQYDTTYAAHVLGVVGPMYQDDWSGTDHGGPYQDKEGYTMNDTIGKSGLELALEPYLHGTAGSRTVETDLGSGEVLEERRIPTRRSRATM